MRGRIFIGLASALLVAACATAGGQAGLIPLWTSFENHPKGYIGETAAIRGVDVLAPPPAAGSPRGQSDLAIYRATRALEGSPRWTLATADADTDTPEAPAKGFDCALGAALDVAREPVLLRMLGRVAADTDNAGRGAKNHYQRPRPFLAEAGPTCVKKEDWLVKQGSYPSGHAAASWAWALLLSELAPSKAEPVLKRGLEFGESRVVCGVHYVSDIEAGRSVGAATVARLKTDPAFMADFARARLEMQQALAGGPKPTAGQCEAEARALSVRPF